MDKIISITWRDPGDCWPKSGSFLLDPGNATNVDCGERTETKLESPFPPSGPLPQAARFTCGHGRATLHVGSETNRVVQPEELARMTLMFHYCAFFCDCIRPEWRCLMDEDFGRMSMGRTGRWLRDECPDLLVGVVWEEQVGPPVHTWRVRGHIVPNTPRKRSGRHAKKQHLETVQPAA